MLAIMRPGIKDTKVLVWYGHTLCKLHAVVVEHRVFWMHRCTVSDIVLGSKPESVHRIPRMLLSIGFLSYLLPLYIYR